ncbi:hypothetical protein K503DRAFT_805218 [Rhizopogon vinicolor AM-OR11-026]|uniref:DUF6533 domain-containing protein n=1 Tax=Rhizopogon vinicolor AM-OR11-026 TaxID=1314800 RepID=A0A1B7MIL9_9AGAM|nr:hypothetical protein K503DRAFT_805218 [Rhizopogon vinicolor AM-OR11-026]
MSNTEDLLELGWVLVSLDSLKYFTIHKIVAVAVTSSWVYDYFLTFADEIAFLTQSQWKWTKLLYVVCRYLTSIFLSLEMLMVLQPTMSIHMCQVLYSVNAYLGTIIVFCADVVFVVRACAIWEHRRSIVVLFLVTTAMYIIAAAAVLSISRASPYTITKSPIPVTSCYDTSDGIVIIIIYVILAVSEAQVLGFAVYKAATSYWRVGNRNRLLEQLIHHNVIYVTCVLVFSVAAILTTALVKESYGFMIARWQVVVHAFLAARMYRGLWRADRRRVLLESFTFSLATFNAAPGMLD